MQATRWAACFRYIREGAPVVFFDAAGAHSRAVKVNRLPPYGFALLMLTSCDQTPKEPPSRQVSSGASSAIAEERTKEPAGDEARPSGGDALIWEAPDHWEKQPSRSRMRQATYRLPAAGGGKGRAEMVVYYFGPNSGGGVEANMKRWRGQFSEVAPDAAERTTRQVHGLKQHLLSIAEGTFSSGMPRGPKTPEENFGLVAAIVESPSGHFFFKLTGPSATVRAERDHFMKLLDSVRVPPSGQ